VKCDTKKFVLKFNQTAGHPKLLPAKDCNLLQPCRFRHSSIEPVDVDQMKISSYELNLYGHNLAIPAADSAMGDLYGQPTKAT
jgi:hypothetical protein